jgi:glycosyltransferase 2 family protein
VLRIALKFIFAGGIIIWLLKRGELDLSLVSHSMGSWHLWAFAIVLMIINVILTSVRWKMLLEIKTGERLPFVDITMLTWIGLFFSSVLPGVVTGDLVKLVYARDLNSKLSKTFLLTSVLIDRVIGLFGLLMLLGGFSLIYYSDLVVLSDGIRSIIHLNFLIFLGMVGVLISIFLPRKVQNLFLSVAQRIPALGDRVVNTLEQVWLIGGAPKTFSICLGMSMFTQMLNISAFWILALPYFAQAIPFKFAFTFIPLGFVAIALPVAPAGMGVGHAIFGTLFSYFNIDNGASLFNLYFVAMVMINLLGVIPYLMSGKRDMLKRASKFEVADS